MWYKLLCNYNIVAIHAANWLSKNPIKSYAGSFIVYIHNHVYYIAS